MQIILPILALALGFVIGFLLVRSQKGRVDMRAEMLERQLQEQKAGSEAQLAEQKADYEAQLANLRVLSEQQLANAKSDYKEQLAKLQEHQREQLAAQKEQMEQGMNLLREQLKNSAEKVLKERSEELSSVNREQLSLILNPLQTGLKQMQEEVEKNRLERSKTMSALDATIRDTIERTKEIGERADKLAHALTRDNKYQGNFGELCLSKMLEDMGFERGKHFTEQTTLRDDAGNAILGEDSEKRMQPDVILHFPDSRDIIIDSKVSMTAFERYANAVSDEERQAALRDHVASVRNQVKLLTQKSYWKQYNQKGMKLDFVVMFMFSESALQLALSEEPRLWHEAYEQGVLITSGQNLYALLRILEISWKQMAQMENQQNIIACANDIVSRVQLFYQRFVDVESQFQKVQKNFDELKTVVAPGGKSIVTSARQLLKYGAKEDPKRKLALPKDEELGQIL